MKKSLLFTCLIIFPLFCFSQTDSTKRETSVVFFGAEPVQSKVNNYNGQALKIGILELISGLYGVYYEKEFSDIFGAQVGGGLTGRNFLYGITADLDEDAAAQNSTNYPSPGYEDIFDADYQYGDRDAKIGYFFAAMPKFYFDEDGFDGPYFALNFQYRRYNYVAYGTVPNVVNSNYSYEEGGLTSGGNDIDEFENQVILGLAYGGQSTNTKTILDYHTSIGFRKVTGERRDLGYRIDNITGSRQLLVQKREVDKMKFFFEIGFKIGLWWSKD
jgi:hypothetical protein